MMLRCCTASGCSLYLQSMDDSDGMKRRCRVPNTGSPADSSVTKRRIQRDLLFYSNEYFGEQSALSIHSTCENTKSNSSVRDSSSESIIQVSSILIFLGFRPAQISVLLFRHSAYAEAGNNHQKNSTIATTLLEAILSL